jgi:hypothetical protein
MPAGLKNCLQLILLAASAQPLIKERAEKQKGPHDCTRDHAGIITVEIMIPGAEELFLRFFPREACGVATIFNQKIDVAMA